MEKGISRAVLWQWTVISYWQRLIGVMATDATVPCPEDPPHGDYPPDGPKAGNAATIRLDRSVGADHVPAITDSSRTQFWVVL